VAPTGATRIQLCGRLVASLDGQRVEDSLPGPLGRLLFAYLVLNRRRRIDRDQLLVAVYGEEATPEHQARLSVLLSKLRRGVGAQVVAGRAQIELLLPAGAFVDVEAALAALHRAESHVSKAEWAGAWGSASVAYDVASRPLLPGQDRSWLADWRRRLDEVRLSALECLAVASLGVGGSELPQAVSCARLLVELAPFRESGYTILMDALEQSGNAAEAVRIYDRLRLMLRHELGIAPSSAVREAYQRLLARSSAGDS
jgi:DNA-binding SARP family transcriptional activator